jgi:murein DD-endopeptidase MepM/ murein hydrolase activator NlpD
MRRRNGARTGRRGRAGLSAAVAVCLGIGLATTSVAADDPEDQKRKVDNQISATQDDLDHTSRQLRQAYDALEVTRGKLPAARAKAEQAVAAEVAAQSRYDDAAAALRVAEADEAKARKDIAETSRRIAQARENVAGFAGEVYQQQGLGTLSVAFGAESPAEIVDRMVMADTVGGVQAGSLDTLNTSRADLVTQQDRLEALRDKTRQARDAASARLGEAKAATATAEKAQGDLEAIEARQSRQASTLAKERGRERKRLAALQDESDRLGRVLEERARKARIKAAEIKAAREAQERRIREARARASRSSSTTSDPNPAPPPSQGVLAAPVNAPVTSEFGLRFHPILHYWRLHAGRDYGGACGTPVYAAANGTIISAGTAGGYGNQIAIDHGVKRGVLLSTTYNHLQSFARTGGSVSRGQVIGYVGTTGTSTGCHLHFETYENGTAVDPRGWL